MAALGVFFVDARAWAFWGGLAVAALAHGAYFASTLSFGTLLIVAAACATGGLAVAAAGARSSKGMLGRSGFAVAALGGFLWTVSDVQNADMTFMVGNVFATVGWALAAVVGASE